LIITPSNLIGECHHFRRTCCFHIRVSSE